MQGPRAIRLQIPDAVAGTRETLKIMRVLILHGKKQPAIRHLAVQLVRGCAPMDWDCEARCCFDWVQKNIRYVRDMNGVETLHYAGQVLQQRAGDCDDISVVLASILESIGVETQSVAIACDRDRAGAFVFSHVYIEALIDGAWVPLDATEPQPFGWCPPDAIARMEILNQECEPCP